MLSSETHVYAISSIISSDEQSEDKPVPVMVTWIEFDATSKALEIALTAAVGS